MLVALLRRRCGRHNLKGAGRIAAAAFFGSMVAQYLVERSSCAQEPSTTPTPPTESAGQASTPSPTNPTKLTLPAAVAFARAHQPIIRRALAKLRASKEAANIPRSQWQPQVTVGASFLYGSVNQTSGAMYNISGAEYDRIAGTPVVRSPNWSPYASSFVSLGIKQEVFDFGRIAAQTAEYDAQTSADREQAKADSLDVDFAVEEAYFSVLASKGILRAAEEAYGRTLVHRNLAKAGVASGLRSPIELTRAEADLARFDAGRIGARGGVTLARSVLAAAIGGPDLAVDTADDVPTAKDAPALASVIRAASENNPYVRAALEELKAEEARTKSIGAESRPNLSFFGVGFGYAGGAPVPGSPGAYGGGYLPSVPNYAASLILRWPLFDPVVAEREKASRAREQVLKEQVDLIRQRQVGLIRQTYIQLDAARTKLVGLEQAATAARANYAQADARFNAGMSSSVELADAEALRTDSEVQFAIGQFDVSRARAAFGRSIAEGL